MAHGLSGSQSKVNLLQWQLEMMSVLRPFISSGTKVVRPHAMALALTRLLEGMPGSDRGAISSVIAKLLGSMQVLSPAESTAATLNRPSAAPPVRTGSGFHISTLAPPPASEQKQPKVSIGGGTTLAVSTPPHEARALPPISGPVPHSAAPTPNPGAAGPAGPDGTDLEMGAAPGAPPSPGPHGLEVPTSPISLKPGHSPNPSGVKVELSVNPPPHSEPKPQVILASAVTMKDLLGTCPLLCWCCV